MLVVFFNIHAICYTFNYSLTNQRNFIFRKFLPSPSYNACTTSCHFVNENLIDFENDRDY